MGESGASEVGSYRTDDARERALEHPEGGRDPTKPVTWRDFFDHLNAWGRENGAAEQVIFDNPYPHLLGRALFGPPFAYVCWGLPKRGSSARWLRFLKLEAILRAARVLVVHDPLTQRRIRRFVGRDALLLPHPVDTEFFQPRPDARRDFYVLVPGDNDRNEEYVFALAEHLPRIVRVARDPRTRARYEAPDVPDNIVFEYRVPWTRLRELYQYAAAVVLPTGRTTHAAGQQGMLEALACGVPVFSDSAHLLGIARSWGLAVRRLPKRPGDIVRLLRETQSPVAALGTSLPPAFSVEAATVLYRDVLAEVIGTARRKSIGVHSRAKKTS